MFTNVLLRKLSSKRSSNRTLHQKVQGKKGSRCLQTEAATEVCELHSKESVITNVFFFGCSRIIPLLDAQNESSLFFFRGAGEQAKASDIPQIEKRESAVLKAQQSESLTFSVRCILYSPNKKSAKRMFWNLQRLESKRMSRIFRKVRGAVALLPKAKQENILIFQRDVLFVTSLKSEARKPCCWNLRRL